MANRRNAQQWEGECVRCSSRTHLTLQMLRAPLDRSIGMLVVSPTRELAQQIAEEAKQLTAFQQNFTVQVHSLGHVSPKIWQQISECPGM